MERQDIPIRFADLRRLASTVPAYLAQSVGVGTTPPLRADVEEEFGMIGFDTESLILQFAETYRVELASFDFTGYVRSENVGLAGCLLFLPFIVGYLAFGWLLKTVVALLCWPFASSFAQRIWQQPVSWFWLPAKQEDKFNFLTAGDFVASAAAGQFVKREQVYFHVVR